jgi:LysM repeat protein
MAACRYMQFDPENYPVKDYKFNTTSTLGIIAREYEVTQLVQLLQNYASRVSTVQHVNSVNQLTT